MNLDKKKQIATHFMQELNVDDTKHEDKLVEDEIPEFILKMLKFIKSHWNYQIKNKNKYFVITCCSDIRSSPKTTFCIDLPKRIRQQ